MVSTGRQEVAERADEAARARAGQRPHLAGLGPRVRVRAPVAQEERGRRHDDPDVAREVHVADARLDEHGARPRPEEGRDEHGSALRGGPTELFDRRAKVPRVHGGLGFEDDQGALAARARHLDDAVRTSARWGRGRPGLAVQPGGRSSRSARSRSPFSVLGGTRQERGRHRDHRGMALVSWGRKTGIVRKVRPRGRTGGPVPRAVGAVESTAARGPSFPQVVDEVKDPSTGRTC
jgi:hypothetical protein